MKNTKIICLAALKGGTGKTTLTFQCATALAALGKEVLVVDVDPQANLTLKISDIDINKKSNASVDAIFSGNHAVVPQPTDFERIDIIPATIYLALTSEEIVSRSAREKILYNYLKKANFIWNYDYVFFDTSPSMNTINQNVFYVADDIYLIAEPDESSISGIMLFEEKWKEILSDLEQPNNIKGIITNKVNTNLRKTGKYYNTMHQLGFDIATSFPNIPATIESEVYKHAHFGKEVEDLLNVITKEDVQNEL